MKRRLAARLALFGLWTAFIFGRSLQPGDASTQESQLVLELLRLVGLAWVPMHFVRKAAHFTEFFLLGALAERLCRLCRAARPLRLLLACLAGLAVALCDETIQLFVPGRFGCLPDVWLDFAGACAGALCWAAVCALYAAWQGRRGSRRSAPRDERSAGGGTGGAKP